MATEQPQTDSAQTPSQIGPVKSTLDVDSLVDRYFSEAEAAPATPTPADKTGTPMAKTDTPEEPEPVLGDEDTSAEDEGGVETGEEPEEETPEETLPEEDEEVEALLAATDEEPAEKDTPKETFLPEFDRVKFLKENPALEAPYKHMQAAFSRKMAETGKIKAKAEEQAAKAEVMQKDLLAFEDVLKNDESFEEFLVQVSLNRPEVMERAYERAVTLNEDEGKKKEYLQGRELAETKRQLKEREDRVLAVKREARTTEIISLTQRVAARLGLTGEGDLDVAEQYVANRILQNVADGKERDISPEELVGAVRRAAKALAREKAEVRQTARAEHRKENLKAAQDRARQPKRPAPPRPGVPVPAPASNRIDHRPKQAPLESWIDQQLGVEP